MHAYTQRSVAEGGLFAVGQETKLNTHMRTHIADSKSPLNKLHKLT